MNKNILRTTTAIALSTSAFATGCGAEKLDYNGCNPSEARRTIEEKAFHETAFNGLKLVTKREDEGFITVTDRSKPNVSIDDPLVLQCGKQTLGYVGVTTKDPKDESVFTAENWSRRVPYKTTMIEEKNATIKIGYYGSTDTELRPLLPEDKITHRQYAFQTRFDIDNGGRELQTIK